MRGAVLALFFSAATATGPSTSPPLFARAPGPPVTVGPGSGTVLLADLNRDGTIDLITRHLESRRIALLLGEPGGTFSAAREIPLDYSPGDIKIADLDTDGILDLAITPSTRDVVDVRLGDGRGNFTGASGSPFTVSSAVDEFP
jgi:hypothetical protein